MDICVRKPLVVTCSSDRSVRIWNFQENSLEYCKFFLEEAYAVSIHPSGFHVLVSFSDRIKMINIGAYNHWYEEPTQSKEYFRIKVIYLMWSSLNRIGLSSSTIFKRRTVLRSSQRKCSK